MQIKKTVDEYVQSIDWRVNENANMSYSLQNLFMNVTGQVLARYAINNLYGSDNFLGEGMKNLRIGPMHEEGKVHIHDMAGSIAPYCFTGDTKVSLLNGTEVEIKNLVGLEDFWVYSCKPNGEIVPGHGHSCKLVKKNTKILKVTIDNEREIKCTPDHKFMMRDGSYKEARHLVVGDSLMPYKLDSCRVVSIDDAGFEDVYCFKVDGYHNFALTVGVFQHNCGGWGLQDLLDTGFAGDYYHISSTPAKHLRSACNHIINFIGVMGNEFMGAQAFSDVDLFLSPLVLKDYINFVNMTEDLSAAMVIWKNDIKQSIQELLFNLNFTSRWGGQCVTSDTECLTENGWKTYDQLKVGDQIYTFNMGKHCLELKLLQRININKFNGNMIEIANKNKKVCQQVTPNHKVVRRFNNYGKYVFEDAINLCKFSQPVLPLAAPVVRDGVKMSDDEIRLLAWVLSDANMEKDKNRIRIYQSKSNYILEIRALLNRLKVPFTESVRKRDGLKWDHDKELNKERKLNVVFSFMGPYAKKYREYTNEIRDAIPEDFKKCATSDQIKVFIDEYIKADGNGGSKEIRKRIYKKDKNMVSDIQEVLTLAGIASNIMTNKAGVSTISVYKLPVCNITSIKEVQYDGIVWCPTTENGTFVARRNGSVFITGNSPFSNITFALSIPSDFNGMPIGLRITDDNQHSILRLKELGLFDGAFGVRERPESDLDSRDGVEIAL